jgi:hypothetical protein
MALSETDRTELNRLDVENVKLKLGHAGPGPGSVVPGLGPGFGMTRSDVEDWLAERSKEAAQQQSDILWWAKAAAYISAAGIVIAVIIALLGK